MRPTRMFQLKLKWVHCSQFTTWRYEPPEAAKENSKWSRRYDTWSFGCITLEFIVWLVYGTRGLDDFNKKIVDHLGHDCHYFEKGRDGRVKVHPEVVSTMKALSKDSQCKRGETALGDLLNLVSTRLLVIQLELGEGGVNDQHANTQAQSRANSTELRKELDSIIRHGNKKQAYWFKGESSDDLPSLCTPDSANSEADLQNSLVVTREHPSGSVGGLLTTDSSSLVVPILTGSVRVG